MKQIVKILVSKEINGNEPMSGTSHTFQEDRQLEWSSSRSGEDDSIDHNFKLNIRKGKI